jgi:hypothetical protein
MDPRGMVLSFYVATKDMVDYSSMMGNNFGVKTMVIGLILYFLVV